MRDSAFYGSSIVLFILFAWDGYIEWWESFVFLAVYGLYIVFMVYNDQLLTKLETLVTGTDPSSLTPVKSDIADLEAARGHGGSDDDITRKDARVSLTLQAVDKKRQESGDVLQSRLSHITSSSGTSMARASSLDPSEFRKLIEPETIKQARRYP